MKRTLIKNWNILKNRICFVFVISNHINSDSIPVNVLSLKRGKFKLFFKQKYKAKYVMKIFQFIKCRGVLIGLDQNSFY